MNHGYQIIKVADDNPDLLKAALAALVEQGYGFEMHHNGRQWEIHLNGGF